MRRWHDDYPRIAREWHKHRRDHVADNVSRGVVGRDPRVVDCVCDRQPGRFRKHHAFGCGRPRCQHCHGDKYPRRTPTRQERLAGLAFREAVAEIQRAVTEEPRAIREGPDQWLRVAASD